jgi:hypothetical protein
MAEKTQTMVRNAAIGAVIAILSGMAGSGLTSLFGTNTEVKLQAAAIKTLEKRSDAMESRLTVAMETVAELRGDVRVIREIMQRQGSKP